MKDDKIQVVSTDENDKGLTQSDINKYANRLIVGWGVVVGSCVLYLTIEGIKKLRQKRIEEVEE